MLETEDDRRGRLALLGAVPVVAAGGTFEAVFEHEYLLVGDREERTPTIYARTLDLVGAALNKGHSIRIAGVAWRIRRIEPDGTGMSVVILEAVQ